MIWEIWLILGFLIVALASFIRGRWPVDLTAIGVFAGLVAVTLVTDSPHWPTFNELVNVFSNHAPLTIGAMFIVSAALERSGAIDSIASLLNRFVGLPYALFLGAFILIVGLISAFVNNTVVVVVLMPVVLGLARNNNWAPSKFLIPLSYASIFGGCCTAIGTSTNLLASGLLEESGYSAFTMFELAWVGVPAFLLGWLYLVTFGNKLLPAHSMGQDERFLHKIRTPAHAKHPFYVIAILIGAVALVAFANVPIFAALVIAVAVLLFAGLIPLKEAYRSVDSHVLVLLYGMLALGVAMEKTGFAQMIAMSWVDFLHVWCVPEWLPYCVLCGLYLGTMLLTEVLSNNATIMLIGPLAIELAEVMQIHPRPFMIAACIASSAGFMIPTGYQTHTYVYGAGRYSFRDFLRIGWPLDLLYMTIALLMIPFIWPLR